MIKKEKHKKSCKKTVNNALIIIIIILIIALVLYYINQYNYRKKREEMLKIAINNIETSNNNEETIEPAQTEENKDDIVTPTENELKENKDSIDNYTTIGILEIPTLKIKYPIISETSNASLKISVAKYWGANPNEVGNMVIVGHNYKNSYMLSKLPNIQIGDKIKITDNSGTTLSYIVYETKIIDPYDNDCTSQLTNGKIEITLITCTDNGENRFYAKARVE